MRDEMSEQAKRIGKKIKELSEIFPVSKNSKNEENIRSILQNQPGSHQILEKNLFIHLGELFISSNDENTNNLIAFLDEFGRKLIQSRVSLDQSIHFIYLTRCSIMELLEWEFREMGYQ